MQTVIERPAALDVHKASVTACVRVPSGGGVREQHVEEFAATVRGLLSLRDWLAAFGVTHVAMEASGVYFGSRRGRSWRTSSTACWSTPGM